eukprot:gene6872-30846_t
MPRANVKFVITGFGSFHGVGDNPTEQLVKHVGSSGNEAIMQSQVLVVSAQDTDEWIHHVRKQLDCEEHSDCHVVLLHLGVESHRKCFGLETRAVNTGNFRCPDERGWSAESHCIDPSLPLEHSLDTELEIPAIASALQSCGFLVEPSDDAGRFICNWLYYRSLSLTKGVTGRFHSLFVHVPPFSTLDEMLQQRFLHALMDCLTTSLSKIEKA